MIDKNKKILFCINNLSLGGAEKVVLDQINCLSDLGYNVNLLSFNESKDKNFEDKLKIRSENIFYVGPCDFNLLSILKCIKFLRHNKFDFIISNLFFSNTLIRIASFFVFPRPTIVIYEHNVYEKEKRYKHHLIDKILLHLTKKIIAVSEPVKEYLLKNGINKNKIEVIKNGISTDFLNNLSDKKLKRKELGFSERDSIFVSVGNVNPQKGHCLIVDVAEKLYKEYPDLYFIICGSDTNPFSLDLKERVRRAGLDKRVIFLGSRKDVLDIVNMSDFFTMPSLWEGLSIALLEALTMGKIVLVSDIPTMKELIKDGINGVLFRSEDSEDYKNKIVELLNNKTIKERISKGAKETGAEYSIEKNIKKVLSVLSD